MIFFYLPVNSFSFHLIEFQSIHFLFIPQTLEVTGNINDFIKSPDIQGASPKVVDSEKVM